MDTKKCERCNGTGEIGRRTTFPLSYIGPGPVPEDATNAFAAKCDECDGRGYVAREREGASEILAMINKARAAAE